MIYHLGITFDVDAIMQVSVANVANVAVAVAMHAQNAQHPA